MKYVSLKNLYRVHKFDKITVLKRYYCNKQKINYYSLLEGR